MLHSLLLVTTLAILSVANSQPPTPSALRVTGQEQQKTAAVNSTACQSAESSLSGPSDNSDRVTYSSPIKIEARCVADKADRDSSPEWVTASGTVALALITLILAVITGFLAFYTFRLWSETAHLAKDTRETADRQSAQMTRSAVAMEEVAQHIAISARAATDSIATMKDRTAQQMRAYICPVFGAGIFQERKKGLRFEGKVLVLNAGHTPAHNLRFRTKAAIAPVPLPINFDFTIQRDAEAEAREGGVLLGPQQNMTISGLMQEFVPDDQVEDIKIADTNALYVWGIVTYSDVFGVDRTSKFCQMVAWLPDGKTTAYYPTRHNEAT